MEQFKLPEKETRLVKLGNTVYKIKLVYISENNKSKPELPCDAITMQFEVEEVIRVFLTVNLAEVKTDHFIVYLEEKRWRAASHITFTENHDRLNTHPFMLTLYFRSREDVGNMPADNRVQSSSAESAPQKQQGGRKRTRRYVVRGHSHSDAKKSRSSDRSDGNKSHSLPREETSPVPKEVASAQSAEVHSHYLLRRGSQKATAPTTTDQPRQGKRAEYHLRSRELTSRYEDREKSDGPTLRSRSGDGKSDRACSRGRRNRQGRQDRHGEAFHPSEAEPEVGATAGPETHPAYPEGGVADQTDRRVRHPGRCGGNQFQHAEQIRLQKLAGIPRRPRPPPSSHYQLRPKGAFGRMMDALMSPVKSLFGQ